MSMFICLSCGTQYAESRVPPPRCDLCHAAGFDPLEAPGRPVWTTLDEIRLQHSNLIQRLEPDLFSVRSIPTLPPGQRALLLRTQHGNVLWGAVTVVDDETVRTIQALGGVTVIAVSQPRHLGCVIEWSHSFGGVPVYIHATSRRWLMRPDAVVQFWNGESLRLADDVTLTHIAGGADGGTVLHWPGAAGGRGALLTGDVMQAVAHRRRVGLLSSSMDLRPRSAQAVRTLLAAIEPLQYEALYDARSDGGIARDARAIVLESAECYLAALDERQDETGSPCGRVA
jgi:hypothetical protein